MRGRKSAHSKLKKNTRNAAQKETQRKVRDDDGGWEDLVESATLPATIKKTFRVSGLVALPSAAQAALVVTCVFYAFGSALLFCIVALASCCMLVMFSTGATTTIDCEEEMLECITLAHLERRFRRRTLRLDDCIHYVLFKIMRLVEAINTLRRSMLDYSFTVSIAPSSASHDLLELVDAADKDKKQQQQQQQQLSKAASMHQKKKKKQKKSRVETIYSGQITVEEYTYVPETRAVEVKKEEVKLMATAVLAPVEVSPVLKKVDSAVLSKQVMHNLKEESAVALEQLKVEDPLPNLLVPKIRAPAQPKAQVESVSQTPKQVAAHSVSKPVEKKKSSKPALRIETIEQPKDDVQSVMQLSQVKKQPRPVVISPSVEKKVVPEAKQLQQQVEDVVSIVPVPAPVLEADVTAPSPTEEETADKPKRRRPSRTRRSRTRRSTLSVTERPSSFYEEFLLLEPLIVKPLTPKNADKNQELYTTEAQKVRSLQQTLLPFETKTMSNPEIRVMVDEMNNMVSGMHAALVKNWEFLASLSEETALFEEKEEQMKTKKQPELPTAHSEKLAEECAKGVRPASELDDELLSFEEPEFEDERFGDLEDDDHYYASRPMSAPCL